MVKTNNRPWGGWCWLLCQVPAQGQTPFSAIQQLQCPDLRHKAGFYSCRNIICLDWYILIIFGGKKKKKSFCEWCGLLRIPVLLDFVCLIKYWG